MGVNLTSGSDKNPAPAINVTPLVDVVLVLLIIFMVVTPAVNEGEQIELPMVQNADPKQKDLNPVEITVPRDDPSGGVTVNSERLPLAQALKRLKELHEVDPQREALIKTDKALDYKKFRELLKELQDIGYQGVSLKVQVRDGSG